MESEDYPDGLLCAECDEEVKPGDWIASLLIGYHPEGMPIVESVCLGCAALGVVT